MLYLWTLNGKKIAALLFSATSVLCVYFHLLGVLFVFIPLGCVFIIKLLHKYFGLPGNQDKIIPGFPELSLVTFGIFSSLSFLLVPAFIQRLPGLSQGEARFSLQSISGFVHILSGSSNNILCILFLGLIITGNIALLKKTFLLGSIFLSIFVSYFFVLMIIKPNSAQIPLVMARYMIPAFPMSYALVAFGIERILKISQRISLNDPYKKFLCNLFAVTFVLALFWTGPLKHIYSPPNNFTKHSAFQESYTPIDWDHPRISQMINEPYGINKDNISVFYKKISKDPKIKKIIEYPMRLGNHYNIFYYYQHYHKKNIAIGYITKLKSQNKKSKGDIYGDMIVDQVMSKASDPGKLKFRNMIDLMNIEAVRKSGADYVIFHKDIISELFPYRFNNHGNIIPVMTSMGDVIPLISSMDKIYRRLFGRPVFEDKNLIVYRVIP